MRRQLLPGERSWTDHAQPSGTYNPLPAVLQVPEHCTEAMFGYVRCDCRVHRILLGCGRMARCGACGGSEWAYVTRQDYLDALHQEALG